MRVSMAQARRMRQQEATISSIMENSTPSAGWKRSMCRARRSSKHSRDSVPRVRHRASRPWRSAFCAESCFPSGVDGPRERAPLARDERVRLSEDIAVNINLHPAGLGIHVSRVFATQKCCDRRLGPAHLCIKAISDWHATSTSDGLVRVSDLVSLGTWRRVCRRPGSESPAHARIGPSPPWSLRCGMFPSVCFSTFLH